MSSTNTIEIPLSKSKLIKLLLISIAFLIAGFWIIIKQPEIGNSFFNHPLVKNFAAYGGAIMGLFGTYYFLRKLFDKKPGLIIDEAGIINNTSIFSLGLISWNEISEIYEYSIQASIASKERFITIGLVNPNDLIIRETNSFKRKLLALNIKNYGSPIYISTNSLKISHNELLKLLQENLYKYKSVAEELSL